MEANGPAPSPATHFVLGLVKKLKKSRHNNFERRTHRKVRREAGEGCVHNANQAHCSIEGRRVRFSFLNLLDIVVIVDGRSGTVRKCPETARVEVLEAVGHLHLPRVRALRPIAVRAVWRNTLFQRALRHKTNDAKRGLAAREWEGHSRHSACDTVGCCVG